MGGAGAPGRAGEGRSQCSFHALDLSGQTHQERGPQRGKVVPGAAEDGKGEGCSPCRECPGRGWGSRCGAQPSSSCRENGGEGNSSGTFRGLLAPSDRWGKEGQKEAGKQIGEVPKNAIITAAKPENTYYVGSPPPPLSSPRWGGGREPSQASAPGSGLRSGRRERAAHFPPGSLLARSLARPWAGLPGPVGGTLHTHSAKSIYVDYSPTLVKNGAKVHKQTDFWDCFNLITLNYLLSWP